MRVFVLGAGASYHVGYPLTRDLCPKLLAWAARNEPSNQLYWPDRDQLSKFGSLDDIEELVSQVEKVRKPGLILEGLRDALCGYFDSIRPNDAALYRRLARGILQPGDVIITFNYDVSLDRELRRAGKWEVGDGYGFNLGVVGLPPSPTKLLKLHGSTNWMDSLFDGLRAGTSQGGDESLGVTPVLLPQEFEFLEYPGMRDPRFKGGGMTRSGSMILPSPNKQFFVSTSINPLERERFWSGLWGQAAEALQNADEIVIIGYSMPSADTQAPELIFKNSNHHALVVICCGSRSNDIGNAFVKGGFLPAHVRTDLKQFEEWLASESIAEPALALSE